MWSIFLAPIKTQIFRALALTSSLLFLIYIFSTKNLAVFSYLEKFLPVFFFIFAASLLTLLAMKLFIKMYLDVPNEGLKRLGLILCTLSGLLSCYLIGTNQPNSFDLGYFLLYEQEKLLPPLAALLVGFIGSGFVLLLGRKLYLWVQAGFNSPHLEPAAKLMEVVSEATPAKDMTLPSTGNMFTSISNFYSNSYKGKVKAWKVFVYGYLLPLLPTEILSRIFTELDNFDALYWLMVVSFIYNIWLVVSLWRCSSNVTKPFLSYLSKALSFLILLQSVYLITLLISS